MLHCRGAEEGSVLLSDVEDCREGIVREPLPPLQHVDQLMFGRGEDSRPHGNSPHDQN